MECLPCFVGEPVAADVVLQPRAQTVTSCGRDNLHEPVCNMQESAAYAYLFAYQTRTFVDYQAPHRRPDGKTHILIHISVSTRLSFLWISIF